MQTSAVFLSRGVLESKVCSAAFIGMNREYRNLEKEDFKQKCGSKHSVSHALCVLKLDILYVIFHCSKNVIV